MHLIIARIGRAHGLKGEVSLDLRTDIPDERLAPGTVVETDPASAGPLTVVSTRTQGEYWYGTFAGINDREAAEGLRGVLLVVEEDASDEEDAWYPHELVGLRAERPTGEVVGEVTGLEHLPAQDLLLVRQAGGFLARIPFVKAIVPVVDIPGGRVVVDPPFGLLAGEGEGADDAR